MNSNASPALTGSTQPDSFEVIQTRTEALWPTIASDLRLERDAVFRRLRVNSKSEHHRCILRVQLTGGAEYVLKADFSDARSARFGRNLERHKETAQRLKAVQGVSVPEILWQDACKKTLLMELARGETAFRTMYLADLGFGDRNALLRRIGHAVASLHSCSPATEQAFSAQDFLTRISRRARDVRAGKVDLPRAKRFLGLCAYLQRAGKSAEGAPCRRGLVHGDLHFRNILISPEVVSFVDFSGDRVPLPYWDIANLWLANGLDHLADAEEDAGFGQVAKADWQAFEAGYGAKVTLDPVFQFLFALRLWEAWSGMSGQSRAPDLRQKRKLQLLSRALDGFRAQETANMTP